MDYPQQSPGSQQPAAKKGGYGKRPLWQWIVIYLIVGGIVYYGIYYFAYGKKGGYNSANVNYNTNSANYNYNYNYNTNG